MGAKTGSRMYIASTYVQNATSLETLELFNHAAELRVGAAKMLLRLHREEAVEQLHAAAHSFKRASVKIKRRSGPREITTMQDERAKRCTELALNPDERRIAELQRELQVANAGLRI